MGKNFDVAAYKAPTNPLRNGECTAYCWGRAYEVMRGSHNLPTGDAGTWFKAKHGYLTGQIPKATSIGCFTGHVIFIEDYDEDTDMLRFSEANYYAKTDSRFNNGKWEPEKVNTNNTDGLIQEKTFSELKKRTGGGTFQGFIYLV